MGHHKDRYLMKQRNQLINKIENTQYYQHGSEWKSDRTQSELDRDRKAAREAAK